MLAVCSATVKSFTFMFSGNKSHCLSLSKLANVGIGPMLFDDQSIAWCHWIKYLGVHLLIGKGLSFGISPIKIAFYAAYNNIIFSFSWCWWNHPVVSWKTYCLPVLLYASLALYLRLKQLPELKVCSNSTFHKIFYFSVREAVKLFIFWFRQTWPLTCHYAAESFFLQSSFSDWQFYIVWSFLVLLAWLF